MRPKKERNRNGEDDCLDKRIASDIYPVIDTDLARDNLENDLSDADLQDM